MKEAGLTWGGVEFEVPIPLPSVDGKQATENLDVDTERE